MINYNKILIKRFIPVLIIALFIGHGANSQILISLIFGDKLNSGNIEFGLEGGLNFSDFQNLDDSKRLSNLNLGFYFYLKQSDRSYISTGVLVKSNQGADELPPYSLGEPVLDSLFSMGGVTRTLSYFQVPIAYHYRFTSGFYLEAGFQIGLNFNAADVFKQTTVDDSELSLVIDTNDQYSTMDAGLLGGLGYKFKRNEQGLPGLSFGTKYYYGLVDISVGNFGELMNDNIYLYVRIPIGAGKAMAKDAESAGN